tara:strand:+ start:43771 stop:44580 length:810 start_codon:yes stop_codon:yes gene_type:complete
MNDSVSIKRRLLKPVLLAAAILPVSGCIAAAPAIMMAASGIAVATSVFGGYKVYQSVTGGDIGIELENEHIDPGAASAIHSADQLAFWASPDRSLIEAAQIAEAELSIGTIISPATTSARAQALGLATDLSQMTRRERQDVFARASAAIPADLIVGLVKLGVESEGHVFSMQRQTLTQNYQVILYQRGVGEIWTADMAAVVHLGGNVPSNPEVEATVGQAIVDRLREIAAGATHQQSASSSASGSVVPYRLNLLESPTPAMATTPGDTQ